MLPCCTDPFLVTTDMRNAASDGREWPEPKDPDSPNGAGGPTPGGACDPVQAPTGVRNRCNYAAEIENLDRLFGLVLDEVERKGQTDNTVVCIASDHGGDHPPPFCCVCTSCPPQFCCVCTSPP